jgi:hypothetical protein
LLLASGVACAAVTGCASQGGPGASLQDSFSADIFATRIGNSDGLNSPYASGSKFTITVVAGDGVDTTGWRLTSSNSGVISVGGVDDNQWSVVASGTGQSTLSIIDTDDNTIDSTTVEVDRPTDVTLYAQGLLLTGSADDASRVGSVQMIAGGTANFLVRYFAGSQELAGNNGLMPTGSGVASARAVSTDLSPRDFLEVTAPMAGMGSVDLGAGMADSQVAVTAVDPATIASVALAAQSESGAQKGQTLYVFGRALDDQNDDVFGASFSWAANDMELSSKGYYVGGPTDLLTYVYDTSQPETVNASAAGFSASVNVHGLPPPPPQKPTPNLGCSVALPGAPQRAEWNADEGAPTGLAGAAIFGVATLLASRRRRRPPEPSEPSERFEAR